jgi:hypothetical protein
LEFDPFFGMEIIELISKRTFSRHFSPKVLQPWPVLG